MRRLLLFVAAISSLLGAASPLQAQTIPTNTQVQREVDRALARLGATDSFTARAVAAGTPAAAMEMGLNLARHGLARLDSATLRVRAEVLMTIFSTADEATCAAWSRGTLDSQQAMGLFTRMDSVTTARWGEVSAKAMVAEMRATAPSPPPTPADMMGAFTAIKTAMSAADRTKFDELLPRVGTASDAENCWFIRSVYGSALRLPPAERANALSMIARIEAM